MADQAALFRFVDPAQQFKIQAGIAERTLACTRFRILDHHIMLFGHAFENARDFVHITAVGDTDRQADA